MKLRLIVFLSIAVLLVATSVMAAPAYSVHASRAAGPNVPVSNTVDLMSEADTYAYWTPDRMAQANANPLEPVEVDGQRAQLPPLLLVPQGEPGFAPGSAPGQPAKPIMPSAQVGVQPATFVVNYYTYPYPYTWSYMGAGWPNFYPMRTNAKMFITQNGTNSVCSATVVTDGAAGINRLVATAGRCVVDGAGHWDTSVLICPAWVAGHPGPWGCWSGVGLYALTQWSTGADIRYDHGFVAASHTSSTGLGDIDTVIGTNGEAWNQGYVWDIWSFGYPALSPYDGTTLVWTTSSTAVVDDPGSAGPPFPWGIGSNQTAGAMGGAWSMQQRLAIPGYVVSHNDYKYTSPSMPGAMFGPLQDSAWVGLYDVARQANP